MTALIGVRREDKSDWERRVPITPQDAAELQAQGIPIIVQSSAIRAFSDQEFAAAGVPVQQDLGTCSLIFGIKEMPEEFFEPGKSYVFFAHVIKGQPYNMSMLQRMLDLGCTLIDYERVVDDKNRRLIFFGWHAGVAGMIDTLWALGQRLAWEGLTTPLAALRQTLRYHDLTEVREALAEVRARIEEEGLPEEVTPLIVGVAGYGNVSRGAQEILDLLPVIEIEPEEVPALAAGGSASRHHLYKTVFKEWHMVEPKEPGATFELQDYYQHPEKYRGTFEQYLPHLTVLTNAIFWTERYPRLVTRDYLRELFAGPSRPPLRVIGDISCDVEGAIQVTVKSTEPGDPIYVYDPATGKVTDGHEGEGVVIMAVDILPSELPREASTDFSRILKPFIPALAAADMSVPFAECNLPPEIRRAVIAYQGELTPDYRYIEEFLTRKE
ncbi:MAG: bifunctional lysine ketoglutarate reductase /saccharopine dehydrogenase family protein [Anaerolineae bacterium]|jgi:alpha-aminoadipic semialdehyde synthase|nr:bifunctional lysine ketoglutarate reductase /saccharopine dehydrogenase family protein [Anaerolineae bacterium]MDX9833567.1 bifunctional lysine ketoglutarate reductase /saccharopine dehydrogenase family protein [Anaerolineae bacterium]